MKRILLLVLATLLARETLAQPTRIFPSSNNQFEPYLSVNPIDPNNIIAVAIVNTGSPPLHIGAYYSRDGGTTWNGSDNITPDDPRTGDPVLAIDGGGNAYVLYQPTYGNDLYPTELLLRKSTDGGATWSNSTVVYQDVGGIDKPWMTSDLLPNSSGNFDIYISVTSRVSDLHRSIVILKSTDGGLAFNVLRSFYPGTTTFLGSYVAIALDNEVFVGWTELQTNTSSAAVQNHVYRSIDGGISFQLSISFPVNQIGQKGQSNDYYVHQGLVKADCFPRIGVDRTPTPNSSRGVVYIVWSNKGTNNTPDIMLIKGTRNADNSIGWQPPVPVASATTEEWSPAISVGPDGNWSVLYYEGTTNVNDAINVRLITYNPSGSIILNQSLGVVPGFKVVNSGQPPLGDYVGVANWYGKTIGVWEEVRDQVGGHANMQLYFDKRALSTPSGFSSFSLSQVDEGGGNFGKVGHYKRNRFVDLSVTVPYSFVLPVSSSQTFRASQEFKSGTIQKYNNWSIGTDVVNHKTLSVSSPQASLTARFKPANSALIQTCVAEGGLVASTVEFKDPWLIDTTDQYGQRNRGMNAPFIVKSTPFNPNTNSSGPGSEHKGVFLGQGGPDPNNLIPPYYSVRAVQPIYGTGLIWNFSYWTYSNASVSSSTSLETPVVFTWSNATVTANYNTVVKPQALDGVYIEAAYDGKIQLTWSDHPSANVTQYKIYRKVTPYGGTPGSPVLIATLNRGTTTYKDNAYYYSDEHTTNYIAYDVRCFHQPSGTYSDPRWWETFGSTRPTQAAGSGGLLSSKRKPSTITFEGYPNPFNPSTQLMYSLKEDSYVQLRVYDVLGRTVAELAEGFQRAGYYSYTWSALKEVTGIYFARLIVKSEQEKPSILTSKLLLAK